MPTSYIPSPSELARASVWQSLSFGPNYKAAYCLSVCPAGEEILPTYELDRAGHLRKIVKPLQDKVEDVYVVKGSDAEEHVTRRFPHKTPKHVRGSLQPDTIAGLLRGMPHVFQREKADELDAVYHFRFTGKEERDATVAIREGEVTVERGLEGAADVEVTADSETWLGYLAGRRNMVWAILTRKVRVKGRLSLLRAFERCFPR